MTAWTPERERRAIVAHVARCGFCWALLEAGHQREDLELLEVAAALVAEHVADEQERLELASRPRQTAARRA